MVQIGGHVVHRGPGKATPGIDGPLVAVEARECGQQRGVNIDQAARVVRHKSRGQDAHETGQHHQGGMVHIDGLHQSLVKRRARVRLVGKSPVVHHLGRQTQLSGHLQTFGIGPAADHGTHARLEFLVPCFSLGHLGDGRHVGAAARNQNHDVAHDWNYHERPQPRLALRQNRTIVLKVHEHQRPQQRLMER